MRSPAEYEQGHIPGAISLPLFQDHERAEVGTIYKKQGKDKAFDRGLEIIGPKLHLMVKEVRRWSRTGEPVYIHCWRGGMRSGSFAWLLNQAGIETIIIDGGYKAFRQFIREFYGSLPNLQILGGFTGTGKTEVLHQLLEIGEQVLDLEELACHKGSVFGGFGARSQMTSEQFQNEIYFKLQNFNTAQPIWVEDEGISIGKVFLPDTLWLNMQASPLTILHLDMETRIQKLVSEYGKFTIDQLEQAILSIEKKLGQPRTKEAIDALHHGDLIKVAILVLHYYDRAYQKNIDRRKNMIVKEYSFTHFNPKEIAAKILAGS
jgi:tRNA 2-selenouridine synthase